MKIDFAVKELLQQPWDQLFLHGAMGTGHFRDQKTRATGRSLKMHPLFGESPPPLNSPQVKNTQDESGPQKLKSLSPAHNFPTLAAAINSPTRND